MFVSEGQGLPLAVTLVAGQRHESPFAEVTLEAVPLTRLGGVGGVGGEGRRWPSRLAGDRGLSVPRLRVWLAERGTKDLIPHRADELKRMEVEPAFDAESYKRRNVIERLIGWLKELRRIATRYEKLALHYLAMVKIGMIRLYLRRHFADTA